MAELDLSLSDALTDSVPQSGPESLVERDFVAQLEAETFEDQVGETVGKTDYIPLLDNDDAQAGSGSSLENGQQEAHGVQKPGFSHSTGMDRNLQSGAAPRQAERPQSLAPPLQATPPTGTEASTEPSLMMAEPQSPPNLLDVSAGADPASRGPTHLAFSASNSSGISPHTGLFPSSSDLWDTCWAGRESAAHAGGDEREVDGSDRKQLQKKKKKRRPKDEGSQEQTENRGKPGMHVLDGNTSPTEECYQWNRPQRERGDGEEPLGKSGGRTKRVKSRKKPPETPDVAADTFIPSSVVGEEEEEVVDLRCEGYKEMKEVPENLSSDPLPQDLLLSAEPSVFPLVLNSELKATAPPFMMPSATQTPGSSFPTTYPDDSFQLFTSSDPVSLHSKQALIQPTSPGLQASGDTVDSGMFDMTRSPQEPCVHIMPDADTSAFSSASQSSPGFSPFGEAVASAPPLSPSDAPWLFSDSQMTSSSDLCDFTDQSFSDCHSPFKLPLETQSPKPLRSPKTTPIKPPPKEPKDSSPPPQTPPILAPSSPPSGSAGVLGSGLNPAAKPFFPCFAELMKEEPMAAQVFPPVKDKDDMREQRETFDPPIEQKSLMGENITSMATTNNENKREIKKPEKVTEEQKSNIANTHGLKKQTTERKQPEEKEYVKGVHPLEEKQTAQKEETGKTQKEEKGAAQKEETGKTQKEEKGAAQKEETGKTQKEEKGAAQKEETGKTQKEEKGTAQKEETGKTQKEEKGAAQKEETGKTQKEEKGAAQKEETGKTQKEEKGAAQKEETGKTQKEEKGAAQKEETGKTHKEEKRTTEKEEKGTTEKEEKGKTQKEEKGTAQEIETGKTQREEKGTMQEVEQGTAQEVETEMTEREKFNKEQSGRLKEDERSKDSMAKMSTGSPGKRGELVREGETEGREGQEVESNAKGANQSMDLHQQLKMENYQNQEEPREAVSTCEQHEKVNVQLMAPAEDGQKDRTSAKTAGRLMEKPAEKQKMEKAVKQDKLQAEKKAMERKSDKKVLKSDAEGKTRKVSKGTNGVSAASSKDTQTKPMTATTKGAAKPAQSGTSTKRPLTSTAIRATTALAASGAKRPLSSSSTRPVPSTISVRDLKPKTSTDKAPTLPKARTASSTGSTAASKPGAAPTATSKSTTTVRTASARSAPGPRNPVGTSLKTDSRPGQEKKSSTMSSSTESSAKPKTTPGPSSAAPRSGPSALKAASSSSEAAPGKKLAAPSTARTTSSSTASKVPGRTGTAPPPRTPRSKTSSTDTTKPEAGGAKVQVVSKKLDLSHVTSRLGSKDNMKHVPGGGNVQIINKKVDLMKVTSKCGSKDNIKHKPGGGDRDTLRSESLRVNVKGKAQSKVVSVSSAGGPVKADGSSVTAADSPAPPKGPAPSKGPAPQLEQAGDSASIDSVTLDSHIPETSL